MVASLKQIIRSGVPLEDFMTLLCTRSLEGDQSEDHAHLLLTFMLNQLEGRRFFEETYGLPPVLEVRPEYPINKGFIDVLVFHADASLTAIEVKPDSDTRTVVQGIGQAIHYSVQLGLATRNAGVPRIRRCLAAFHAFDQDVADACAEAGTLYYPLGPYSKYAEAEAKLREVYLDALGLREVFDGTSD